MLWYVTTMLYINNCVADLLVHNSINHLATKHIEVHYHYICECIANGLVGLHLIGSNNRTANILTKSLKGTKHDQFCLMMGMEFIGDTLTSGWGEVLLLLFTLMLMPQTAQPLTSPPQMA